MTIAPSEKTRLVMAAIDEARRGMKTGEAPIGSVLALPVSGKPGHWRIVARGFNRVNALQRKNAHAEIVCLENAGGTGDGKSGSLPVDADDIVMACSLEPCVMCWGAAMEAGITHVLFALEAPADSGPRRVRPPDSPESTDPKIEGGICRDESRALFEEWLEANKDTEQAEYVKQLLASVDKS